MKTNNINKKEERVEVMALFGYEMTPCQPLNFKYYGEDEIEVTELLKTQVRFVGNTAQHIFDVLAGREQYRLIFDSTDLSWHATAIQFFMTRNRGPFLLQKNNHEFVIILIIILQLNYDQLLI